MEAAPSANMMQLSPETTTTLPIRRFDWTALQTTLEQLLEHRMLIRIAGPREPSALDRVAEDIERVEKVLACLALRCNEVASTPLRALVVRTYRWALEVTAQLTDLDVATLDREVTSDEAETFGRHVTAEYLAILDPAFDDVLPRLAYGSTADAALHWDVETLRVAVERVILHVYAIG